MSAAVLDSPNSQQSYAQTQLAPTRQFQNTYDFGDDNSWQDAVQSHQDISQQISPTRSNPTPMTATKSNNQSRHVSPRPPQSHPRQEWLQTDDPSYQQFQSPPRTANQISPNQGGRGRADRVRQIAVTTSPSNHHSPNQPVAAAGTHFHTAYPENRPSDTTVAPTFSEEHGMNLYNPNQISWAGHSIPPPDVTGLQVNDNSEYTDYPIPLPLGADPSDLEREQLVQQQQQQHQTFYDSQPTTSRPSSRRGSRPASRNGTSPPQQHQSTYPTNHFSSSHPPASLQHSNFAPIGTQFEAVYADHTRPFDTSIAPTWSEEHGMHLYNPNQISWAGGVPPPGQKGLQVRELQPGLDEFDQQQQQQQDNGNVLNGQQQYDAPNNHHSQLIPQHSQSTPAEHQHISAPIMRSQVFLDENGNRVVRRYVDQSESNHVDDSGIVNSSLPPVTINPQTGLPNPVYSTAHGMNLFIPSEVSYANNLIPAGVHSNYDRGFRQPVLGVVYQHEDPPSQQQVDHVASTTTTNSSRPASTLGKRVQVNFQLNELNLDSLGHSLTSPAGAPISGSQSARVFSSSSPSPMLASPPSARTSPAPLLRVPTVVRANAAALAQARAMAAQAQVMKGSNRLSSATDEFAPVGTSFETVYAANAPSDPSAAPVYSEEHGMHLYNPNQISWANNIPSPDRIGLRPTTSGGPIKAFAKSPNSSRKVSPMPPSQDLNSSTTGSIPSPSSQPHSPSPPQFRRQPSSSSAVPRSISAKHAKSHPSMDFNISNPVFAASSPTTPRSPPTTTSRPASPGMKRPISRGIQLSPLNGGGGSGPITPRVPAVIPASSVQMDGFVQVGRSSRTPPAQPTTSTTHSLSRDDSPLTSTNDDVVVGSHRQESEKTITNVAASSSPHPPSDSLSPSPPTTTNAASISPPRKYPKAVRMDF